MESRRGSLVILLAAAASLTLFGPATAMGQVPNGCTVPPGQLIPPDPPDGYPNVGVIVAINGRYNAELSTIPAGSAVGAPLPLSVAQEYNWGPNCRGHVRFVFFEDPPSGEPVKPATDPSGAAIKSVPKGTGTVALGDPVQGAKLLADLAVEGIVPSLRLDWPPDGDKINPPPDLPFIPTDFEPAAIPSGAGADAPVAADAPVGARGQGAAPAGGDPFPHGAPPKCKPEEMAGTWHITFRDGLGIRWRRASDR